MFWKKKNKNNHETPATDPGATATGTADLKVIIKTDVGNVRTNNEDSASFVRIADENIIREKGYLLIVADGMGGHLAGEVASKMAVDIISEEYFKEENNSKTEKMLAKAFTAGNKKIYQLASSSQQYNGMGTTSTALAIVGQTVFYAHVGDSRAYLYKNRQLTRVTEDHTLVQQMVNAGDITPAEADIHPQRNVLTNAMGTKEDVRVDTGKCVALLETGDRLMLCSDGLYDYLDDDEIAMVLDKESIGEAADYFIAEAKKRGGADNITVIVAEMDNAHKENTLKATREVYLPKLTRDADLPTNTTSL